MFQLMLPLLKISHTSQILIFRGALSILEDEESTIPPLETIPSFESFKSKESTSMLPISLKLILVSQSKELVGEKEEDNQIFDQF